MTTRRHLLALGTGAFLAGCAAPRPDAGTVSAGFVQAEGARLWAEAAGSGPPVVFVHGFSLDTRMWDDQFAAFAARHRVVRYDARGFGRSDRVAGSYSVRDDLRAVLDHFGFAEAHLVGLSMGGRYVGDFALEQPARVKSLVLVDAVLGGYPTPVMARDIVRAFEAGRRGDMAEAKRIWMAHDLFKPASEQPAVAARLVRMVEDYGGWHFANPPGLHERPLQPPAAGRLAEIRKPTLVVVGSREVPELRAAADKMAAEIPGARQVVLPGVGHMSNMEAPAAFNRAVLDFLAGVR